MTFDPAKLERNLGAPAPSNVPLSPAPLTPAWSQGEFGAGGLVEPAPRSGVSALLGRLETSLGVSLRGQALILAIGASVVVVTLGQLQAFAVHENQRDARSLVARLGPALSAARASAGTITGAPVAGRAASPSPGSTQTFAGAFDLRSLGTLADAGLDRLGDVHWLPTKEVPGAHLGQGGDGGDVGSAGWRLKRHGYVFALGSGEDGQLWLSAWPWEYGRSGREAYAWCSERGELRFANRSGLLSGPTAVPEPQRAGWVPR